MIHLMKNLIQWISYCNKINYPFINIDADLEDSENTHATIQCAKWSADRNIDFIEKMRQELNDISKGEK